MVNIRVIQAFILFDALLKILTIHLGAPMGVLNNKCDDAKTNLTVDYDLNFQAFTCTEEQRYPVNEDIEPSFYQIPKLDPQSDVVYHYCMSDPITYKDEPPLRGDHRPNWAVYGEYLYVPPQRWLHNIEHGAIVMLYHPCANQNEIEKLRYLVTNCLYRHIITPYNKLSPQRPLALIAWAKKLEMNTVDVAASVRFIQKFVRLSPEDLSKQGQYDEFLLKPAEIVSDQDDNKICPFTEDDENLQFHLDGLISPLDHLPLMEKP